MRLTDYLQKHELTHAQFAAQIGATQAAVTRYANGRRKPSLDKLILIESVTDGAVRAKDFVSLDTDPSSGITARAGFENEVPPAVASRKRAGLRPAALAGQSR